MNYLNRENSLAVLFTGKWQGRGPVPKTGSTTDGRRGLGMTFAYRSANLYVYSGNITLTEAVGSL